MKRLGLKILHMYIPQEMHKQLKQAALKYDMSMTQIVLKLVMEFLQHENQHE